MPKASPVQSQILNREIYDRNFYKKIHNQNIENYEILELNSLPFAHSSVGKKTGSEFQAADLLFLCEGNASFTG